jgi:hypothetical protein
MLYAATASAPAVEALDQQLLFTPQTRGCARVEQVDHVEVFDAEAQIACRCAA